MITTKKTVWLSYVAFQCLLILPGRITLSPTFRMLDYLPWQGVLQPDVLPNGENFSYLGYCFVAVIAHIPHTLGTGPPGS